MQQAHQTSVKYVIEISEFEEVGLTPEFIPTIIAPFVKESSIKNALSLQEVIPIKLNDTYLVIGKVISVQLPDDSMLRDGFLQMGKAASICSLGISGYV